MQYVSLESGVKIGQLKKFLIGAETKNLEKKRGLTELTSETWKESNGKGDCKEPPKVASKNTE